MSYDNIDNALDTKFESHLPIKAETKDVMLPNSEDKLDKDYATIRRNLYDLINQGNDAIQGILDVAKAGDSPRAYEVVSQLLKTVAEMNKDVLDVHDKVKKVKEDGRSLTQKNTTNNTIYVGSTNELQDLINPKRSAGKNIKKV
tara:strand:+ start:429 stop:860 length:432 start_codon:yes stop_codon:yes gene_type:complete